MSLNLGSDARPRSVRVWGWLGDKRSKSVPPTAFSRPRMLRKETATAVGKALIRLRTRGAQDERATPPT